MKSSKVVRGLLVVAVAACVSMGATSTAAAANKECAGRGVPDSKISVQLWTFAEYIDFGDDIPRTEEVLRRLSEMGYRNVEPFSLGDLTAAQYRALLDKYGLKASARHVDVGTPERPGGHRTDPRRQPEPRHQVLRLRLDPDLPADLHHRGAVGRVRPATWTGSARWHGRPARR